MNTLVRIRQITPLDGFRVLLRFSNDTEKEIDLAPFLRGPVFACIRADPATFRSVAVDPLAGTIVWPNGADIDPDVLYHGLPPAWASAADREKALGP